MKKSLLSLALMHALSFGAFAQTAETLDEVTVVGVRQRLEQAGRLAEVVEKTEVLTAQQLERQQADTLAKAIETAPGIRVQNECSMCGIKRVMINGMKGEQTTILVDGVPMHSVVSGYYGIDAIASAGIEAVEIARGPGAALSTPEAIGGAINIIPERATANGWRMDLAGGENGYGKASVIGTGLSESGASEGLIALQYDHNDRLDSDANGVSESPILANRSVTARGSMDFTDNDQIDARVAIFRSDVFGGPFNARRSDVDRSLASGAVTPASGLFEGGDVRRRYLGKPYETAEIIDTAREEYMLRYTRALNDVGDNFTLTGGFIKHGQDSVYEGFDYRNSDKSIWLDARYTFGLGAQHLLSIGANLHSEKLRSESDALALVQALDPTVVGDSFDYRAPGVYLQDLWTISDAAQLSLALRVDRITTDYIEQTTRKNEISATLVSPRALFKLQHGDAWTSRFSAGRGYRAPLSFFETDHGLIENGYEVEIKDLERSLSYGYALSYATDASALTASLNTTAVDNLAFIDFDGARPALRNAEDKVRVNTADFDFSHELNEHLSIGGGAEKFLYSTAYEQTFGIPPIEERVRLFANFEGHQWQAFAQLTWVGARDLSKYDTGGRFNVFDDANGNEQVDPGELRDPKTSVAPSYFTLDARVERALGEHWSAYLGANNLTDYTQAGDEESPLFYGEDGGYDVVHIYGPLRGRVAYLGIQAKF